MLYTVWVNRSILGATSALAARDRLMRSGAMLGVVSMTVTAVK